MSKDELEKCQAAVDLAKMRKGIKEKFSPHKNKNSQRTLAIARKAWLAIPSEERKRIRLQKKEERENKLKGTK